MRRLREAYLLYGKMKLQYLLAAEGVHVSASKIVRILASLARRRLLVDPPTM